jgi:uncharacterized protein DUF1569
MGRKCKTANRRTLKFNTLDDLVRDVQDVSKTGVNSTGNWSAGQIVQHVAAVIDASIDGFSFTVPLPMRILGRLIRGRALKKGLNPGIKMPRSAQASFKPGPETRFEDAAKNLAQSVDLAKQRTMTAVSPIFGQLTHEQWIQLHCRHAEMHFSFLHPAQQ